MESFCENALSDAASACLINDPQGLDRRGSKIAVCEIMVEQMVNLLDQSVKSQKRTRLAGRQLGIDDASCSHKQSLIFIDATFNRGDYL